MRQQLQINRGIRGGVARRRRIRMIRRGAAVARARRHRRIIHAGRWRGIARRWRRLIGAAAAAGPSRRWRRDITVAGRRRGLIGGGRWGRLIGRVVLWVVHAAGRGGGVGAAR